MERSDGARLSRADENLVLYGPVGTGKTHLAIAPRL
ncbi:ATP-binding protein [Paenibacillus xerothermodurans]|nr:ATP-binding protein [Paenibacillus xerothermodurans]